jgi:hypothetical protein
MINCQPISASRRAKARPRPRDAPVIKAVRVFVLVIACLLQSLFASFIYLYLIEKQGGKHRAKDQI